MPNDQLLKVAIVTGSGKGIGAACAKALAAHGFKVSLMSPSEASMELARELGGIGRRGSVVATDDVNSLVSATLEAYGRIDAVITNMGHGSTAFPEMTTLGYDAEFRGVPARYS